ncbi:MAG: hypothetical protein V3U87_02930 [Methylococcaceae bacterium]
MPNNNLIETMDQAGHTLQKSNVRNVIFVHGTFVGDDPLGINWLFDEENVPSWITTQFRKYTKETVDTVFKDLGNFTNRYVDIFSREINTSIETKKSIECFNYLWDGQNNHIGRLEAIPDLVQKIADSKGNRTLLIGHSHAGQLFALITLFLEQKEKGDVLFEGLEEIISDEKRLNLFRNNLNKIREIDLDIVTLGAPVRYPWGRYEKYQLLNIVNHRSDVYIDGVLYTRDGDYVQHWGIEGTDIKSAKKYPNLLPKLDKVLDTGSLDKNSLHSIRSEHKRRVHKDSGKGNIGINVFIDYEDEGKRILPIPLTPWVINKPNFIESGLGHGAYTLEANILRNTKLILENLY